MGAGTVSVMRFRAASLSVVLCALALPSSAQAQKSLWATVNVCDTARHPYEVGVRASMPGFPRGTVRRMRFRIQYSDAGTWRYVNGADSGWRTLSRARGRPVEAGWSFDFPAPAAPVTFRGVVRYRWMKAGRVVGRAMRITEAGHRSTIGADPPDYSAATCSMG
jgi:hypothetical protein